MTTVFEAPDFTSESILGNGTNTITSVELPPSFDEETVTTRVRKGLDKVSCPKCGRKVAEFRLAAHVDSAGCLKAQGEVAKSDASPWAQPEVKAEGSPPKPTASKAVKAKVVTGRRVKADDVLTLAAGGIGTLLGMSGVSPAGGMALKLEAPLLGPALDKAVAGTIVDKAVIQPLVKTKGKFDEVAPLVMFPALVAVLERSPAMLPQVYPFLRMAIVPMLDQLVVSMRKQALEEEKLRAAAAELSAMSPEFAAMFESGSEPVDAILEFVIGRKIERVQFVPDQQPVQPEPGSAWSEQ